MFHGSVHCGIGRVYYLGVGGGRVAEKGGRKEEGDRGKKDVTVRAPLVGSDLSKAETLTNT